MTHADTLALFEIICSTDNLSMRNYFLSYRPMYQRLNSLAEFSEVAKSFRFLESDSIRPFIHYILRNALHFDQSHLATYIVSNEVLRNHLGYEYIWSLCLNLWSIPAVRHMAINDAWIRMKSEVIKYAIQNFNTLGREPSFWKRFPLLASLIYYTRAKSNQYVSLAHIIKNDAFMANVDWKHMVENLNTYPPHFQKIIVTNRIFLYRLQERMKQEQFLPDNRILQYSDIIRERLKSLSKLTYLNQYFQIN
jgi:hypothetical protein